ncbi:MAG TPA: DUF72 domain-containing protein [Ignisphaera sp.]|nr:DUF72 domain-containing protein [Ignisphaera sp.]
MLKRVFVGCCGFPVSRNRYFTEFKLVELQNTFYDLPSESDATSLRNAVPADAVLTMKAWQVITHPATSPTWKKMKNKPEGDLEKYGYLRPTKENFRAWEKTVDIAKILRVRAIVLQTPPSFRFSEDNLQSVIKFFEQALSIAPRDMLVCWEPRGDWNLHRNALKQVIELGIVHVVDILKNDPIVDVTGILYVRLHGLGKGEVNYRYKYTDADLENLVNKVLGYSNSVHEAYILFNNIYMFDDALRFRHKLKAVLQDIVT